MSRKPHLLIGLLLLFSLLIGPACAGEAARIFVLHAYSQEYPWTRRQHHGFMQTLGREFAGQVVVETEYLDTKRRRYTPEYAHQFAAYLRFKYDGFAPAAIYVTDDNALTFGLQYLTRIFPDTPVVFSGVNDVNALDGTGGHPVTGVFEKKEIAPNLALLAAMGGSTGRIVVVGDASGTYHAIEQELRRELRNHPDIEPTFVADERIETILEQLRARPDGALFLTTLGGVRDANGQHLPLRETIRRIGTLTHRVIISMEDAYLFDGVLGGYVTSGTRQGSTAAGLIAPLLRGEPLPAPVTRSPNEYLLDARELTHHKLNLPSEIAPGVTLLNAPPSFFQRHQTGVVSALITLSILLIVSLALFTIMVSRKNRVIQQRSLALEDQTAYLNGILGSSEKVALIATDPDERVRYYSPSAEQLLGLPVDRVLGRTLTEIHESLGVPAQRYGVGLAHARDQGEFRFTVNLPYNHDVRILDGRISLINKQNTEFAGYMLMCEDVSEQRRASETIEYQASYDALTDLPNRRLFMDQLNQALARARRHAHQCAVLFLDLDNFKTINDSLGHQVGDDLLRAVAVRLREAVREEDTVARLGGDEFVVLVAELADNRDDAVTGIQTLASNLCNYLAQSYLIGIHELHVTPSIGVTVFPNGDDSANDILRQADVAMYQAKDSGRNTVRFFLPSMQQAAEQRLATITQLRQAVPGDELRLCYQPQYDATQRLVGAEALLRWQHPEKGMIMPGEFIHLAEESGLILAIGNWVLHQALRQFESWHRDGRLESDNRVAVNVSAVQFRQADFVSQVERALSDTGAEPDWLTLEMTESILLRDFDEAVKKIDVLKRLGVRFAIDDFGTGYSSLAYLKRLPVDEIKIDRSFVRDVMVDANDAALVDSILTLARHIGLEVVAEGVESEVLFDFLSQRGCALFQGYYFGRPSPAADFENHCLAAPAAVRAGS